MTKNYTQHTNDLNVNFISKFIFSRKPFITFLFVLFGIQINLAQTTVTITTTGAGTFTVPCDVTSITVQAWGAGGAGGGTTANSSEGGGGGAGGTYVSSVLPVTAGTTYNLFVAPTNNGANSAGAKGQGSWFLNNTTLFAEGGNGGAAPNNGTVAGGAGSFALSIGTTRTAGSNGASGTLTIGGAGGDGANTGGAGGAQRNTGGNGNNGVAIGGGGGGAFVNNNTDRSGGSGARGEIRITYTSTLATYCLQSFSTVEPITNVTYAGINNTTSNTVNGTPDLESFCSTASVQQGGTNTISLKGNTNGNFTNNFRVYIDWDQNGTFGNNANEIYDIGTIINSTGIDATTLTGNITVPITATLGNTRMRVIKNYNAYTGPCIANTYGQTEDYNVTVTAAPACVAPTAQPTALALTPFGTTINGSFVASVPVSDNYLVVMNTTGIAPTNPVNGTSYIIGGTLGAGNTIVDNDTNTTFTATGLTATTTYYFFIYSFNSACSGGPLYLTTSPLTGNTTTVLSYCTAGGSDASAGSISNVNFNTIDRFSGFDGYINTGLTTPVTKTIAYNLSVSKNILNTYTTFTQAWIDWNQDGDFADAGEIVMTSLSSAVAGISTRTVSVTVPAGAVTGNTRMRVMMKYNAASAADGCDTSTIYMDVEDFYINVQPIAACVAPTTQPTALMLTPSGNTISGAFSPAVPNPNNYLVVMNTTGTPPTNPVNGTTYTIGGTLGVGNTIIDTDNNTSFVATGLTTTTTYYFFIYSYNSLCTGGPLYNTTSPLTGTTTTTTADPVYCTPSVGATFESLVYFNNISFVGTLNDVSNTSSYSSAPRGYQDFSAIANRSRQAQGQGVNISMQMSSRGYVKGWVDWNRDGDFIDAGETVYDTGGIATYSTTFGFIIPAAQPLGNYRVRIRINKDDNVAPYDANAISTFGSCGNIDYYGETEDYTFTVVASCSAIITGVTDGVTCGPGTVNLAATSSGGATQFRWYTTELGGTPLATTATGSWTTPSISTTTVYWVTSFNGCESLVRTKVTARVNPLATISFTPSVPEICGENQVLSLTASGDVQQTYLVDEKFDSGLGVCTNQNIVSNGGATDAISQWQRRTSTFVPAQQVWFPAIASGLSGNGFAMSTSDTGVIPTHNAILTPTVSTNTYLDLTLSFDIFYSRYYVDNSSPTLDYVTIDISTDGGTAWTEIDRYLTDIGYGTRFANKTYNLNAYINQPNFRVRVRYYGEWCDGLALDNVQLYGNVPLNTSFNWTSGTPVAAYTDFACTIPYTIGTPITTVFVKPTLAQLETPTYSFTATATLSNGCSVSQNVSINNKTSVWKGSVDSDWNNPNNWLPVGIPTANTCVIIPNVPNYSNISGVGYNGYGRTLQVKSGGNLQVRSSNTLTITDYVDVTAGGTFNLENSASLIQINNVANTGNITMDRNAVTNNVLDYVYWSTPVAGFSVNNVTPSSAFRYMWNPTIAAGYASDFGNWVASSGAMSNGRGYIIRGSSGTSTFNGIPNNGDINASITRSNYTSGTYFTGPTSTPVTNDDDNWNLLGNPYPSAISADDFLAANNANLNQFVKIWTHGIDPSAVIIDPFYQDFILNYSTADYITYNALGGTQFGYDGKIGAGQGFFVLMNDANSTSENAIFNNTMRSDTYRNDQFYRTENEVEKHRIWLNIGSPSNTSVTTLVGYTTDATNNLDNQFDAIAQGVKTNFELYSIAESKELIIQGRSLPFNQNDEVTLGVAIPQNGIYTIAISNVDGLFENASQAIYLEDKQLGIFHDLRTAPYTFTGTTGRDENRFVLLYNSSRLSQDDVTFSNNLTVVSNENVTLYSSNENIKSIEVYDLLGRIVRKYNNIDSKEFMLENLQKNNTTLLLKIKLNNGVLVDKKIIF